MVALCFNLIVSFPTVMHLKFNRLLVLTCGASETRSECGSSPPGLAAGFGETGFGLFLDVPEFADGGGQVALLLFELV